MLWYLKLIYAFLADYLENNKGLEANDAGDSCNFADVINKSNFNYKHPPFVLRGAEGRKKVRYDAMKYIEAKDNNSKNKNDVEQLFFFLKTRLKLITCF